MSIEQVLECNIQELNKMYYDQLRKTAELKEQLQCYKACVKELHDTLSNGETISDDRLQEIKQMIQG